MQTEIQHRPLSYEKKGSCGVKWKKNPKMCFYAANRISEMIANTWWLLGEHKVLSCSGVSQKQNLSKQEMKAYHSKYSRNKYWHICLIFNPLQSDFTFHLICLLACINLDISAILDSRFFFKNKLINKRTCYDRKQNKYCVKKREKKSKINDSF